MEYRPHTSTTTCSVPRSAQERLTSPSTPSALSSWLCQAQAAEGGSPWDPPGSWPTATKKNPLSASSRRTCPGRWRRRNSWGAGTKGRG